MYKITVQNQNEVVEKHFGEVLQSGLGRRGTSCNGGQRPVYGELGSKHGRVGYQEWAGYWPGAGANDPFGGFINPVRKYVASRTLSGDLEWQNARLMDAGLEGFVAALKEGDGGEISVCGSISIVRQLLFAGLLDSLTLMVHPVIAGSGRQLFEPADPVTRLTLQDSSHTSKGNAILRYGLRAD